jgi:hypothetical protein
MLADDVFGLTLRVRQKPPARFLEQFVDANSRLGFGRHV